MYYKESLPPSSHPVERSVFFMDGACVSSDRWKYLKTLQLVAAMGYRAVAVDILSTFQQLVVISFLKRLLLTSDTSKHLHLWLWLHSRSYAVCLKFPDIIPLQLSRRP